MRVILLLYENNLKLEVLFQAKPSLWNIWVQLISKFQLIHTDFNCLIYSPISVVHIFQFLLVKRFAVSKLEPMFAIGCIRLHFCGLPTSCPTRKSLLRPAKSWGNLGKFNWTLNAIWNQCETHEEYNFSFILIFMENIQKKIREIKFLAILNFF